MKKICVLAACLALVASLALPAFASTVTPSVSNPIVEGSYRVVRASGDSAPVFKFFFNQNCDFVIFTFSSASSSITHYQICYGSSYTVALDYAHNSGTVTVNKSEYPELWSNQCSVWGEGSSLPTDASFNCKIEYGYNFSVSPVMANPVGNGSYEVSSLSGVQSGAFMYATKEQPKTFVFSDVTANTGTKVSYAITAEGGSVTYHDIGTLEDGFTFASADYPVASYFTVRNTGSTPASYTVTVSDASIDKSSGIALSIWETCLTMGTAAITWIMTGTNFIALIPIAMMLLVFAVLCIRKLIKGV